MSKLIIPRVSEKSFKLASDNVYMFSVPLTMNKLEIKKLVEEQFKVNVVKVNVSVSKGKVKKSYRRRQQPIDGVRKNQKRAYVTLKEGDSIPFFEETA